MIIPTINFVFALIVLAFFLSDAWKKTILRRRSRNTKCFKPLWVWLKRKLMYLFLNGAQICRTNISSIVFSKLFLTVNRYIEIFLLFSYLLFPLSKTESITTLKETQWRRKYDICGKHDRVASFYFRIQWICIFKLNHFRITANYFQVELNCRGCCCCFFFCRILSPFSYRSFYIEKDGQGIRGDSTFPWV